MSKDVPEWQRLTQYCEKHNQRYMQFLHDCPICAGERLAGLPSTPLGPCRIREELVPNKVYGQHVDDFEPDSGENKKPEQLPLF